MTLPEVKQPGSPPAAKARVVVHIFENGRIAVDRDNVALEQLASQLVIKKKETPNLSVTVRGDAAVKLQQLATVLEACHQAGCKDIAIAAKLAVAAANPGTERR